MDEEIDKVLFFLKAHLNKSKFSQDEINYRYEHSLRVTNIGKRLSKIEGANERIVILASLLHDIGKFDVKTNAEHGIVSAIISRGFLNELKLGNNEINEICYAIESHVNVGCGHTTVDTLEAKIVCDADSIDRFGSTKTRQRFLWEHNEGSQSISERIVITNNLIEEFQSLISYHQMYTLSADQCFKKKIMSQIQFYENYLDELQLTEEQIILSGVLI